MLHLKKILIQTALCSATFCTSVFAAPSLYVDGQAIPDSKIHIVDGRIYMSIAELSDYCDYSVMYDQMTNTANFYYSGSAENGVSKEVVIIENKKNLFPTSVSNVVNSESSRTVIKTYELNEFENPNDIDTDSFVLDGYHYSITDITQTGNITTDNKEFVQSVTIDTETNNVNTILNELDKSKEITTEDGFKGVLQLDIASIQSEVKGYNTASYTATEVREYPNLSAPDTSLVPKSINVNGKQYNLADISWQGSGNAVDDVTIPSTYKATAKYTATGTTKQLTGYTTTAEYKGIVSKVIDGKIIYTSYFHGIPIDEYYENLERQLKIEKEMNLLSQGIVEDEVTEESELVESELVESELVESEAMTLESDADEDVDEVQTTTEEQQADVKEETKDNSYSLISSLMCAFFLLIFLIFKYQKRILTRFINLAERLKNGRQDE